jgi:nuclear pore complex protein Nup155
MSTQALILQSDSSVPAEKPAAESLKPVDRAAKTVNDTLRKESAYPELDNYVGRK